VARSFRAEYISLVREDGADADFLSSVEELERDIGLRFDNFDTVSTALIQFVSFACSGFLYITSVFYYIPGFYVYQAERYR
jgi:hypothetical protein